MYFISKKYPKDGTELSSICLFSSNCKVLVQICEQYVNFLLSYLIGNLIL